MSDEVTIAGIHPVYEALVSGGRSIRRIHLRRGSTSGKLAAILELARERGIPVLREDQFLLDRHAAGQLHQGVVAVAGGLATISLEALISTPNPLVLVLDGVQDPQNLGSIIRTAETAGVSGIVIPERRSAPLSGAVLRASAGAADHVKMARVTNIVSALKTMKKNGIWVIGVDPLGELLWTDFDYRVALALVLGGEHRGIRRLVRQHCDATVRLPVRGKVESLNVSVAAGVVLYEIVRQRLGSPG